MRRTNTIIEPDLGRVLLRPFTPGDSQRVARIIERILSLAEDQVEVLLKEVYAEFSERHQHIRKLFLERFEQVRDMAPAGAELSEPRRLLIGSYFLAEYSLEAAALFNPSIVPHPDQTGLPTGALRFVLSLRATGEGSYFVHHVSNRSHPSRPSDRGVRSPPASSLSRARSPTPFMKRGYLGENLQNWD